MTYNKNIIGLFFKVSIFNIITIYLISGTNFCDHVYAQKPDFIATLSGKEVIPPTKTIATGIANFIVLKDSVNFQINLLDAKKITLIQIHNGTLGVNGDVVVTLFKSKDNTANLIKGNPSNFSNAPQTTQESSSFTSSGTFEASDLTGLFTGKTINDLVLSMQNDETYVNVHTENYPEGELRGQILENEG
jgi:hypothetical protein